MIRYLGNSMGHHHFDIFGIDGRCRRIKMTDGFPGPMFHMTAADVPEYLIKYAMRELSREAREMAFFGVYP